MKIAVIGSGKIGGTLATLLAKTGHEVVIGSRSPERTGARFEHTAGVRAATIDDACRFGEVVVLAIHWEDAVLGGALPDPALLAGKIVVDAMNPYRRDGGGLHPTGESGSSGCVASKLPSARVVKAFNTIFWEQLRDQGRTGASVDARRAVFVAGDESEAKAIVSALIEEIGFAPIDSGNLIDGGRRQEPGAPIYNTYLTGSQARAVLRLS